MMEGWKHITNVGKYLAMLDGPGMILKDVEFKREIDRQKEGLRRGYGDCKEGPAFDRDNNPLPDMVGLYVPMGAYRKRQEESYKHQGEVKG